MKENDNNILRERLWNNFIESHDKEYVEYIKALVSRINNSNDVEQTIESIAAGYGSLVISDEIIQTLADVSLFVDDREDYFYHLVFSGFNIDGPIMLESFYKYGLANTTANDEYTKSLVGKDLLYTYIPDLNNETAYLIIDKKGNLSGVTKEHKLVYGNSYNGYVLLYVIDNDQTLRYLGKFEGNDCSLINLDTKEYSTIKFYTEDDMNYEGIYNVSRLVDKKVSSIPFGLISKYFKDRIEFEMYINSLVDVNDKKLTR